MVFQMQTTKTISAILCHMSYTSEQNIDEKKDISS